MKAVCTLLDVIPLIFKFCLGMLLPFSMVDGIWYSFSVDPEQSYNRHR